MRPNGLLAKLNPDRYDKLLPAAQREIVLDLPKCQVGDYRIDHLTIPAEKRMEILVHGGYIRYDAPVIVRRLLCGNKLWMSDSPSELDDMRYLASGLQGNVLIGGLGMGILVALAAQKEGVSRVVVVEIAEDVINLVRGFLPDKVEIIHADFVQFLKDQQPESFDSVVMDIWENISMNSMPQMLEMIRSVQYNIGQRTHIQVWGLNLLIEQVQDECRGYDLPSDCAWQLRDELDLEGIADYIETYYSDDDYVDEEEEWYGNDDVAIQEAFEQVYKRDFVGGKIWEHKSAVFKTAKN